LVFSWTLPNHPKLPKGKLVAVVVVDGWGEANADQYNCIHVAQTHVNGLAKEYVYAILYTCPPAWVAYMLFFVCIILPQ
jgi:hypothetical protein